MAEISVEIGGRVYRLGCADGEETHLETLARRIDAEARSLSRSMGQMNEARLLLMSALMIADRCAEVEGRLAETEKAAKSEPAAAGRAPKPAAAQPGLFDDDLEDALATAIEAAAERIEVLADNLSRG